MRMLMAVWVPVAVRVLAVVGPFADEDFAERVA